MFESSIEVKGHGPSGGIVVVGEAPGKDELRLGKPFVGAPGYVLRSVLKELKYDPENLRMENIFERKLLKNDFGLLYLDKRCLIPGQTLLDQHENLHQRLVELKPKVIVACGMNVTKALLDKPFGDRLAKIGNLQCLVERDKWGHSWPVVPVYHPSYLAREPTAGRHWLKWGLKKAVQIADGVVKPFQQETEALEIIHSTPEEMFVEQVRKEALVAVDIETGSGTITSITFATSRHSWTFSYPLFHSRLDEIKSVLEDPAISKIFHNCVYDIPWLWKNDVNVTGPIFDTLAMQHLWSPELEKGLDDVARTFLFVPEWWLRRKEDSLKEYNALDGIYTRWGFDSLQRALKRDGLWKFYLDRVQPMHLLLCKAGWKGLRVDKVAWAKLTEEMTSKVDSLRSRITPFFPQDIIPKREELSGAKKLLKRRLKELIKETHNNESVVLVYNQLERDEEVTLDNAVSACETIRRQNLSLTWSVAKRKKPFEWSDKEVERVAKLIVKASVKTRSYVDQDLKLNSPLQLMQCLKNLGFVMPKVKSTKHERKESTNDKALAILANQYPNRPVINLLREYRRCNKILTTYCQYDLDPDDRFRFTLAIGPVSSRLSSSTSPWGTGANIQNMPSRRVNFRNMFIADKDHVFVQIDWSQIEAVLVAYLSRDKDMIEIIESGQDIHCVAANAIYGFDIKTLPGYKDSTERAVGKAANHSTNYGLGPDTFMENLAKQGVYITREQSRDAIEKRHARFPGVRLWHREIEHEILSTGRLVSPHGRMIKFLDRPMNQGKMNMSVMRQGYNYLPQTITGDLTNEAWMKLDREGVMVVQQCHDSLLLLVKESELYSTLNTVRRVYESISVEIHGVQRRVKYDVQIGTCWGSMLKDKDWLKGRGEIV